MGSVRIKDRVLHMGEHAEDFDRYFSAIIVNAELFKYEHNLTRFGKRIELEVLHKKSEDKHNANDTTMCLLRIKFNDTNDILLLSVHTDEDDVHWTTDFPKVIAVLTKIGAHIIEEEVTV